MLSTALARLTNEASRPEQLPFARQSVHGDGHERFYLRQLLEVPAILSIAFFLIVVWHFAWFALSAMGWYKWWHYGSLACDQPLAAWLLVTLVLFTPGWNGLLAACPVWRSSWCSSWCPAHAVGRYLVSTAVLVSSVVIADHVGFCVLLECKTCSRTNPELYNFVKLYLAFFILNYMIMGLAILLPLIMGAAGIRWSPPIMTKKAASLDIVKALRTVPYDDDIFSQEDTAHDDRPVGECCCCAHPFGPTRTIKCTPCRHYFHEDCLGRWLQVNFVCPLCRRSLKDATVSH